MTVAVSSGVAYVAGTPTSQNSQKIRVKNSASANVTIAANASGSTKYDWLYISLDATKLANPAVGADDVATLVTSRSSNASTDDGTPPTYGYNLVVITVANGASSITNGNIADKRVPTSYRSSPATSGVNHVDVASSTTGNGPTITAVGTDANIDLSIVAKGTGVIKLTQNGVNMLGALQSWSPTIAGFSASPTGGLYYYTQVGKLVTLTVVMPNTGTSNSATFTLTLPVAANIRTNQIWSGSGQVTDNGGVQTTPGLLYIVASGPTILNIYKTYAGGSWTTSGAKSLVFGTIVYEAA